MANVVLLRLYAIRLSCHAGTLTLGLESGDASHAYNVQIDQVHANCVCGGMGIACVYDGFPSARCLLYFDRECGVLEIETPVVVLRFLLNTQLNVEFERALREVS
jgi:hypothetical protein